MRSKKEHEAPESKQKPVSPAGSSCDVSAIRQSSHYSPDDVPLPDNNMFFEERHNPLSSKGN